MHNRIVQKLINNNFEAYFVGGAVRDKLMNLEPQDFDIVTNARPEKVAKLFIDEKIDYVGESFKVLIVNGIEVATYRKDRYFGLSDKDVEISYADTLEEDLSRRDLTINAIAADIKGNIIDPFNGQQDIRRRNIRFVGNPEKRIFEDPCRILRALRFCCLFEDIYNIDKDSYEALYKNSHLIKYVKPERMRMEILKVMKYKQPSLFFHLLKEFNLLDKIFPSLDDGFYHFDGNNHNETIFLHNMICGDTITERKPLLRLTGYLHDCGKPKAFNENNGKNYRNHNKIGADLAKEELENLKFSNNEIKYITNLIKIHMVYLEGLEPKGTRKLLAKLKKDDINWKELIQLRIADRAANLKKDNLSRCEIKKCVLKIYTELKRKPAFSIRDLKINGYDVMNIFNIKQGKEVGDMLKKIFKLTMETPELNERETLLTLLDSIKEKRV